MYKRRVVLGIICLLSAPACRCQEKPTRFEISPLLTYLRVPDSSFINAQNQAEIGGRFSWNFVRYVALDLEIETSPSRTTNLTTSHQGGHLSQGFVGFKSGKRWNQFGLFRKFRPGLDSYSKVITGIDPTTLNFRFGRRIDPSFANRVGGREVLSGLIVGLNRKQFIDELVTAVDLADFGTVNFGEPVLHFGVFLTRLHWRIGKSELSRDSICTGLTIGPQHRT